MSIITTENFNKLVKIDSIDTNQFLLNILKTIYDLVENNNELGAGEKVQEISHIFKSVCFPTIESSIKPTLFSQMFRDICPIANGGFGVVYKAKHYLDNQEYAIKRIPMYIDFSDKMNISKILVDKLREIRCLATLNHPNIINYKTSWLEPDSNLYQSEYDTELEFLNTSDNSLIDSSNSLTNTSISTKKYICFNIFYQMELMDISLRDVLNSKELKTKENLVFILNKILEGLDYLHTLESPIVHMDIKPENILLKVKENKIIEVKLADFGLIKHIYETGTQEGTLLYMSPEREKNMCIPNSDIYSLGIILYEIVNNWSTEMERIIKLTELKKNPESVSGFNIIKTMLSTDYNERPTAKMLLNILKTVNIME